jgi:methylenetetrahydrofolate dehydrogenase (NADP+)/methenyltetrahydrofolate cyclohydrolase
LHRHDCAFAHHRPASTRARQADILVAAVGRPRDDAKATGSSEGATVIDVGINRVGAHQNGKAKLTGDVDFATASQVAGAITPVPGGVGPMTIAMLMANTLSAACLASGQPRPIF